MKTETYSIEVQITASQYPKEEEYWLNKLSGELVKRCFPYDIPAADNDGDFDSGVVTFELNGNVFSQLMDLCNGSDIRLHIIFAAVLTLLLSRYSGDSDIIIGAPILKQDVEGRFINTILILRNRLHEDMTFKELLLQVKQCVTEAMENINYPLEVLLHNLNMPFSGKDFPLFDVVVLLENIHDESYIRHVFPNMIFSLRRTGDSVTGKLEYNPLRYTQETAARIALHFSQAATAVPDQLDFPLKELDILSPEEKKQLLVDFNQNRHPYPHHKTLHRLFEEQVQRNPDHKALVAMSDFGKQREGPGNETSLVSLTYRELNEQSDRSMKILRKKGIRPDMVVGVMLGRSIEMIIGILGILKAGGAYLPIDPDYPEERIDYMLNDSGARILLSKVGMLNKVSKLKKKYEIVDIIETIGIDGDLIDSQPQLPPLPLPAHSSTQLCYIIYTSGSTGQPRGVMIEQRAVVNLITWYAGTFYLHERSNFHVALLANYTFDASVEDIFSTLIHGVALYIPLKETVLDKDKFARYVNEHQVNMINFVPAALKELLTDDEKLKSLRVVISGGEKLDNRLKDRLIEKEYALYNSYGPTEMTVDALLERCSDKKVSLGKPIYNTRAYILGQNRLHLQPIGAAGELCLSGPGIARGYLNQVESTEKKFIDHPLIPGERLYRTGDLARRLPDGNIEFLDREDNQVKVRGFRIELGEIENRLQTCPQVKEVVVSVKEDKNGEKNLCAYIVPLDKPSFSVSALREYLAQQLPAYMIPAYFLCLDSIPITAHGKLDRRALPEPVLDAEGKYIAPKNPVEEKLAAIWSEILGIEKDIISIDANFFNLGGHSLRAALMLAKVHKELNIKIPLAEVFKTPTIEALSGYIKELKIAHYVSLPPGEKKEYYRLSSAQERMYILHQMDPQNIDANISYISLLEGNLDKHKFEKVFLHLIVRHESLRTSFHRIENRAVQLVHRKAPFAIQYYDALDAGPGTDSMAVSGIDTPLPQEIKNIIKSFIHPFNLAVPPLLRVGLAKMAESRFLLMIDIHHISADGFSQRLLVEDFMKLYADADLSPLELQYKDYCQWQNHPAQKERLKEQAAYWLKEFSGELSILRLPVDFDSAAVDNFTGRSIAFEINAENTKILRQIIQDEGTTLAAGLLAVYCVLLAKYSEQQDVIIGIAAAGRTHADLQQIVGMFVNMLPVRTRPEENKSFTAFLKEIKENLLNAYENQDYPYEELIKNLKLQRVPGRDPLLNAVFTLQNYLDENRDDEVIELGNLKLIPYPYEHAGKPNFLMDLEPFVRQDSIYLYLSYINGLFKEETVRTITQHYLEILQQILENKNIKLKDIKISYRLSSSKRDILQNNNSDFVF